MSEVYASDPDQSPDSAFHPGELRFLVVGNEGRLLDPRRTPVRLVGIHQIDGMFEVEVQAFEDSGACWLVPFEEIDGYQFARDALRTGEVEPFAEAIARLDRPLQLAVDETVRSSTLARLFDARREADELLNRQYREAEAVLIGDAADAMF